MNDFLSAVSNVGFPIVCVFALAWYVKYVTDKHEKEITKLKESIDNNTKAFTELLLYLKEREN